MATTEILQPESAHHSYRPVNMEIDAKVKSSLSVVYGKVNPELEAFTSREVAGLLESVVVFIENQLETAASIASPVELPDGIQDCHHRQIDVCLARFRTAKTPAVSIRAYLHRLHLHCPFSTVKLLAIVHYLMVLDVLYLRISKVLRSNTAHRLVLTAIVIASKILDDRLIPQVRWSVVGGVTLHQLHGLELAFFFLLHGKCWITEAALIHAGHCLDGQLGSDKLVVPLVRTSEADVIWSSVGNRCTETSVGAEASQP